MEKYFNDLLLKPILNESADIPTVALSFILAALLSFAIAFVYSFVHRKREDKHIMMQSLIIISVAIAGAMAIVGNELARAFGLVGAVSVIRFRTAVQSYRDMAFVFVSIVIGMACGLNLYAVGVIICVVSGGLILFFYVIRFGEIKRSHNRFVLKIAKESDNIDRKLIEEKLGALGFSFELASIKLENLKNEIEYNVTTLDKKNVDMLIQGLRQEIGGQEISLKLSVRER